MKKTKTTLILALNLLSLSCSLSGTRPSLYPGGVGFPLEEAGRVTIEGKIIRTMVEDEGKIYLATDKGKLYCLDGKAQKVLWTHESEAGFSCPPAVGKDRLFILDHGGQITCLDKGGNVRWKSKIEGHTPASLGQNQYGVYVGTKEGSVLALNPDSGEMVWNFATGGAVVSEALVWEGKIVFASEDGNIYILSPGGRVRNAVKVGSSVLVTPLIQNARLYVGAEDSVFHCFDLRAQRRMWRIQLGGRILAPPLTDERHVFFVASNCVLFCLNKKSGEIQWWRALPSLGRYDLESSDGKIVVPSSSPTLVCLDRKSGEKVGTYDAGSELRSNALWVDPYLVASLYDQSEERGSVVFLHRQVSVQLVAALASPQPVGTEISFAASAVGFYLPRYEFFLRQGGERTVVQKGSERNTWVWFPDKEGMYAVGVRVTDAKQERETEIPFEIIKGK
ncbi:MAG: PQQ-binding-like beta-propeller repeat protein [Clostridiales bacterium]|nr:PQQ-binding-like beta-propeller repeat protein [Clostridiales bacterium]